MEIEIAALRALADLREAETGLLEEKAIAASIAEEFEERLHPRDRGGRFRLKPVLRPPGEIPEPLPGERPAWDPPLHPNIAQRVHTEKLDRWPEKGPVAKKLLGMFKDTEDMYSYSDEDGERHYHPDRAKLHEAIIDYFLNQHDGDGTFDQPLGKPKKKHKRSEDPTVLFFAGGTATGKSTALKMAKERGDNDIVPDDAVMINPDLIKQMLPEFKEISQAGEQGGASVVHEESSFIAAKLRLRAQTQRFNMIVDGTGDSGRAKFMKKIYGAVDEGYKVNVFMVDLPLNIAIERAILRGDADGPDKGRYVPTPEIEKSHFGSTARHLDWRNVDVVNKWQLWSNNVSRGTDPVFTASGGKGMMQIHDAYEYARIIEKGKRGKVMEAG